MKKFNLQMTLKILFGLTVLLIFQNCSKEDAGNIPENGDIENVMNESQTTLQDSPIVEKLVEMGYKRERIQELDDFYLVEGDLMFSKNITDYTKGKGTTKRHAHSNNLVSQGNVTSITVRVAASIPNNGVDNWRNAISNAMFDWNSISNCKVNFQLTTSSNADITIQSDNGSLWNNTIASAGFPTNNQPYNTILINLDYNSNATITEGSKRYNMVHELGHTLGLRHTNWENVDPATNVGANYIPGTPSQDSNSVMNGGTANNSWYGFSTYDLVAARYLYPAPPPAGFTPGFTQLFSPSSKSITIGGTGTYKFEVKNNTGIWVSLLGHTGNGSKNVTLPVTFTVSCNQLGTKSASLFLFDNTTVIDMADVVSFQ